MPYVCIHCLHHDSHAATCPVHENVLRSLYEGEKHRADRCEKAMRSAIERAEMAEREVDRLKSAVRLLHDALSPHVVNTIEAVATDLRALGAPVSPSPPDR